MGSMAHHIYPYIAYMDPMGYRKGKKWRCGSAGHGQMA